MSLNDLVLPEILVTDLYRSVLTEKTYVKPLEKTESAGIRYLGNNKRKTVIIVNNPHETFISDPDLNFLTKILGACKLTLADVAILNLFREPVTIEIIQKELAPENILLLGVKSGEINLSFDFPLFKVQQHGGCMYVAATDLSSMNREIPESRELKSGLWKCLKILFNV